MDEVEPRIRELLATRVGDRVVDPVAVDLAAVVLREGELHDQETAVGWGELRVARDVADDGD